MKHKVILTSVLTIALCLSIVAGSTFALFTSTSSVNIAVTAGKVNATAAIEDLEVYSPKSINMTTGEITDATNARQNGTTFSEGGTATLEENGTLTLDKIVPGDKATFKIKIENHSTVAAKYRTVIELVEGSDTGLFAGLEFQIGQETAVGSTAWTDLPTETTEIELDCEVKLPTTAGNTYQGTKCTIRFRVEAVQGNTQTIDYGIKWSGDVAPLTRDDSTPANVKTLADVTDTTAKTVKIETPELLAAFAQSVNEGNTYLNYSVTLEADMNLDDIAWTPIGTSTNAFWGNFDGGDHTINNLKITSGTNVGLFGHITLSPQNYTPGIKNLTINNVNISADDSGAFVGNANTTTRNAGNGGALMLENLKLTGKVTIEGKNVGGIVGTEWTDFQIAASNITVDVEGGSYVKGSGVIGGVFASTPHGSVSNIVSNMNVIASGNAAGEVAAGGIVGCAGWKLYDVTCTGNVVATNVARTANEKYQIGKIVGREANNSYWERYNNTTEKYGSTFKNFTANNTISITLTDETGLTQNGMTSADKKGTLNLVDYDQSLVGAAIWTWLW